MINGINDVIAVGSVAVQRGQPCMGDLARKAHSADGGSRSLQRLAGVGSDKGRRQAESWQPVPVMALIIGWPLRMQ